MKLGDLAQLTKGVSMSEPITPAAINLDELSQMGREALWARLPQQHAGNLALYIAACNGCESSLEAMRTKVLERWMRSFKLEEA